MTQWLRVMLFTWHGIVDAALDLAVGSVHRLIRSVGGG